MNDKLAKYLRKTAQAIGEAKKYPARLLVTLKMTEQDFKEFTPSRGVIFNSPESVRGLYRHLKKQARKYYATHPRRAVSKTGK